MTVMFLHTARPGLECHAPGLDYMFEHGISGDICKNNLEMKGIIENNTTLNSEDIKLHVINDFI